MARFGFMGSRRLNNYKIIHLMQEIHSTKNQVSLTIFDVTADIDISYMEIHCVELKPPVATRKDRSE